MLENIIDRNQITTRIYSNQTFNPNLLIFKELIKAFYRGLSGLIANGDS